MKKILLSLMLIGSFGILTAQTTWSDDFESYNDGDFIGVAGSDWTTWGNTPGGADDSKVSNEEAHSGSLSLKMESFSSTGGPADVVLPFGERYTSGGFTFDMWMFVAEGTGAYYNFHAESTVGQNWDQETVVNPDGSLIVRSNSVMPITGNYPQDKWIKVTWLIDLDNNKWELIVDGQCLGFFENNWNTVASLNIYPNSSNNTSIYYIDDVAWEHDPAGLADVKLDAGLGNLDLRNRVLTGMELPISGEVQNSGSDPITSFKVSVDDGNSTFEKEFTGLTVETGESYSFDTEGSVTAVEGANNITMTIVEVNGVADDRDCNNSKTANVNALTPAPNKKVLLEEATGTWCTFCPRGEVALRSWVRDFPDFFVPIAVHGGSLARDPMTNVAHISYITTNAPGFTGYPQMVVDRRQWFSVASDVSIEPDFFQRIVEPVKGHMDIGAKWDATTRTLDVSAAVNVVADLTEALNIDILVVENNINKDSAGYAQVNTWGNNAAGPMGGYENLPNPVPAKDMTYNHVGRGSLTDMVGYTLDTYGNGERPVATFTRSNVNAYHNTDEFHLVAVLSNADGTVNNVEEISLADAISNGYEESTVSTEDKIAVEEAKVYPNPANTSTFVSLELQEAAEVQITVVNQIGQTVAQKNYGKIQGKYVFPVDLGNQPNGVYEILIQAGKEFKTQKLQVIH